MRRQAPRIPITLHRRLRKILIDGAEDRRGRVETGVEPHPVRLDLKGVQDFAMEDPAGGVGGVDRQGVGQDRLRPPAAIFGDGQRLRVDQGAAVGERGPTLRRGGLGDRMSVDLEVEVGQRLARVDGDAVRLHAIVHDLEELPGVVGVGGDEQEVIQQAQEQSFARGEKGEQLPLQGGVEVVAQ